MKYKNEVKNSPFNAILVAVCSFIGVGFITGAEIWFYFARFGAGIVVGLLVFGVLTFVLAMFAFNGHRVLNPKTNKLKTKISFVSEMAVASAMVSGLLETSRTLFDRVWFIVFLLAILVLVGLLFFEKNSFVVYNYFVAIFVIFVIVSLFLFDNKNTCQNVLEFSQNFKLNNLFSAVVFSFLYVFMNISEIRPILEKNAPHYTKKQKIFSSLFLSLTLIFLVVMISGFLLKNSELSSFSMPFLNLFKSKGGAKLYVFLIGLVMTMVSTAEACLIGAKNKLSFHKNDEKFVKIIVIISSLILGQIPFKIFIKIIYPIVAVLNFLLFVIEIFELKKFRKN